LEKLRHKWLAGKSKSVNKDQVDGMLAAFQQVKTLTKVGTLHCEVVGVSNNVLLFN